MTPDCHPMYLEYFSSQYKLCWWGIFHLQAHLCHPHCPGSLPTFFLSHFYHFTCICCVQLSPPLSPVHHCPVANPSLCSACEASARGASARGRPEGHSEHRGTQAGPLV